MTNDQVIKMTGVVSEMLQGNKFKVKLENNVEIDTHVSGKMRVYKIRILPGDKVDVELSQYDLTKGRIVYRHKDERK